MGASVDEAYIERLHEDIRIACEHLENNGFESIIVTVGKSGNVNMGSARGKLFLDDRLAFITDFIYFCKAQVAEDHKDVDKHLMRKITAEAKENKSDQPPKIVVSNSTGTYESQTDGEAINTIVTKAERLDDVGGDGIVDDGFIDYVAWKDTEETKQDSDGDDSMSDTDQVESNNNTQFITVKQDKLLSEGMNIVIKTPVLDTTKATKHTLEEAVKHTTGDGNIKITDSYVARPDVLEFFKTKLSTNKKPAKCYTCHICNKQFEYHGSLASHERAHNREKRVDTIPLFSALQAVKHTEEKSVKHTEEKSVKHTTREGNIESTDQDVTHPNDLEFHTAIPSKYKKPLAKCRICTKQFKYDGALAAHERSHDKEKQGHTCNICNKTFAAKWPLTDHMRMHSGEKPYSCKICNKKFRNSSRLSYHRRTHSDDKPFHCDICGNCYKRPETLRFHKNTHSKLRPYVCEICGKTFTLLRNLSRHRFIHKETVEKRYGCDFCGKRFHDTSNLKAHRRTHTGETPFICDYCGKMFGSKGNLVKHIRIHTGEKPYGCKTCGSKFSDSYTLLLHERIHSGELPYPCGICGKKFRSYSTCKSHTQIHSDEKNYVCDICNKRYKRSSHLVRHKQTHIKVPEAVETIVVLAADEDKFDSGWPQHDSQYSKLMG